MLLTRPGTEALEQLAAALGDRPRVLAADLADARGAAALAERAGAVDVLVANAALPASGPIVDFTPEQIDRALDVNLRAPIQLARALVPGMVERGGGHVVLVSSLSGKLASVGSSLYSAGKFGLRGFAAGLREDLHGTGVGVTVVFPGFISDAGMLADSGVRLPRWVGTRKPEQVADAVVKGIEDGRAEIDVAPLSLRAGVLAGRSRRRRSPASSAASARPSCPTPSPAGSEPSAEMLFRQITHDDLGCASYVIGDEDAGVAAVVDARLDIDEYLHFARYAGVHIEHILETHNHADHVSGHGRLAAATGATIHIHREPTPTTTTSRSTTASSSTSAACACARCTRPATGPSTPPSR